MSQDGQEPPKKKLKQARLPFFNSPSPESSKLIPKVSLEKKRKALDEPAEQRASKTVRKVLDVEKENVAITDCKESIEKPEGGLSKKTDVLKNANKNKPDAPVISEVITIEDSSGIDGPSLQDDTGITEKNLPNEGRVTNNLDNKKPSLSDSGKKSPKKSVDDAFSEKKVQDNSLQGNDKTTSKRATPKSGQKKKPKLSDLLGIKPVIESSDGKSSKKNVTDNFLDLDDKNTTEKESVDSKGAVKKKPKLSNLLGIKPVDGKSNENNEDGSVESDDDHTAKKSNVVAKKKQQKKPKLSDIGVKPTDSKSNENNEDGSLESDDHTAKESNVVAKKGQQKKPKLSDLLGVKPTDSKSDENNEDGSLEGENHSSKKSTINVKSRQTKKSSLSKLAAKSGTPSKEKSNQKSLDSDDKNSQEEGNLSEKMKSNIKHFFDKNASKKSTESFCGKKKSLDSSLKIKEPVVKSCDQIVMDVDEQVDCISSSSDCKSTGKEETLPKIDQVKEPIECGKEANTCQEKNKVIDKPAVQNNENKEKNISSSETQVFDDKEKNVSQKNSQNGASGSKPPVKSGLNSKDDEVDGSKDVSDDELSSSSSEDSENSGKKNSRGNTGAASNVSISDSIDISSGSSDDDGDKTDKSMLKTPNSSATVSDLSETKSIGSHGKPTPKRKLTPKGLLRREIAMKKREEAERLKMEKKRKKQELHEQKMKANAAKYEEKKNAKEERKRKKMMELEELNEKRQKKMEERQKREEEKRQKEEEKKKKKEEKLKEEELKEEAKRLEKEKEEQKKAAFAKFFKPKTQPKSESASLSEVVPSENVECCTFMPFPVKSDMRLAAVKRRSLTDTEVEGLDQCLQAQEDSLEKLYLKTLKSGHHKPLFSSATWPASSLDDHDVIIVESMKEDAEDLDAECIQEPTKKRPYRVKLLQFHENRRPAYWGTWRKKSSVVSPIHPFSKDEKCFDYEVDSDSEWEDEEEGENIEDVDADKESDEEPEEQAGGENGYILDNQFVPHGYLSDEEAQDREEDDTPEAQKLRLTALKEEFDEEMKQKAERLKPRMLGLVWISNRTTDIPKGILYETLMLHRCVWDETVSSIDLYGEPLYESPTSTPVIAKGRSLSPEVEAALVKMVHGSQRSIVNLVKDFLDLAQKDFPDQKIFKSLVASKIRELCSKVHNARGKLVWSVKSELCNTYNVTSIVDIVPKLATPPATGKQKDTALQSFLSKGTSTPMKKRASLTPATTPPVVSQKTPTAVKAGGPKKKVSLITLAHTPRNERNPVHEATPHPSFKILKD